MECSTLAAADKQRAGEDMAKAGMVLLDCPISGGSRAAQKDLVVYGSGDHGTYERCLPIVNAFARANYYLGEFGNGTKMKLVANLLVTIHNVSTAEAMVFGMKSGLDPETIFKVMCDSSGSVPHVRGAGTDGWLRTIIKIPPCGSKPFEKIWRLSPGKPPTSIVRHRFLPVVFSCIVGALAQGLDEQDTASVCAVLEKWADLKR